MRASAGAHVPDRATNVGEDNGPALPSARTTAAAAGLVAATATSVAAWLSYGAVSPGRGAVAICVSAASVGVAFYVDFVAFQPRRDRRADHRVVGSAALLALALLLLLGSAEILPIRAVWLGYVIVLIGRLAVGVAMSSRSTRAWAECTSIIGLWAATVGAYWLLGPDMPALNELVWSGADQVSFYVSAVDLVEGDFKRFSYLLGSIGPLIPAAVLLVPHAEEAVYEANVANAFALPLNLGVAMPAGVWLLARGFITAVSEPIQRERQIRPRHWGRRVGTGIVAAGVCLLVLVYVLHPPGFVPERNAELVPLRVLGFVYGPEPIGFLALGAAVYLLASPEIVRRHAPWVGLAAGMCAMVHERYLLSVGVFLCVVMVQRATRRAGVRCAFFAVLGFAVQILYFRFAYGGWLFPNRSVQWNRFDRSEIWGPTVEDRYGLPAGEIPSRVSLDYLGANLGEFLNAYGAVVAIVVVCFVALWWHAPAQWPLWAFCGVHIIGVTVVSLVYINQVVTWRYNSIAVPVVGGVVVGAALVVTDRLAARRPMVRRP